MSTEELFIQALRAQYVDGANGAVAEFFAQHGETDQFVQLDAEVRDSSERPAAIAEIEKQLRGERLRESGEGESPPAPGAVAVGAVAAGAVVAGGAAAGAVAAGVDGQDVADAGQAVVDTGQDAVIEAAGKIAEVDVSEVEDGAKEAAGAVAEVAGDAAEAAADGAEAVVEAAASEDVAEAVADAAEAVADVAENAAEVVVEGAEAAANAIASGDAADAAADAAEAVADGAGAAAEAIASGDAADAAANAAEAAGAVAGEAAEGAVDLAKAVWDAGELDEAYMMTRAVATEVADQLLGAGPNCCEAVGFDVTLAEIWRDFYQLVSLFFANVQAAAFQGIGKFWGAVGAIAALDLSFLVPAFPMHVWLILLFLFALVVAIFGACCIHQAFALMPDDVGDGMEAKGWEQIKRERPKTMKAIKLTIVLATSVHLPISRMGLQVILCRPNDEQVKQMLKLLEQSRCPEYFPMLGVATLLIIGLGVPIVLWRLISLAKPVGSPKDPDMCYDKDGVTLVEFSDAKYNERVRKDPDQIACPFVDLYKPFERRWAWYKVVALMLKLALAFVVIASSGSQVVQINVSLGIVLAYTLITLYSTPYIDGLKDKTELSGKVAHMCNLGLANWKDGGTPVQVLVFIVMIVQKVVMVTCLLAGSDMCQRYFLNFTGKLVFTNTSTETEGKGEDMIVEYELERELLHRIWQPFWDGVLVKKYGEEVGRRHFDLKRITENEGLARIETHWREAKDPDVVQLREAIKQFEGVDCMGPKDFGKMYIKRYPFECVCVCDDGEASFLDSSEKIQGLLDFNRDPEVVARWQVRTELRAMHKSQESVHWDFEQTVSKTVEDGTETTTDSEGNTHTKTVYSTIQVQMHYSKGTIQISARTSKRMAAGFNVAIAYVDGEGDGVAPRTGRHVHFENEHAIVSSESLNFNRWWRREGELGSFLAKNAHAAQLDTEGGAFEAIAKDRESYREEMEERERATEALLPSEFWYRVYANEHVTRADCKAFFNAAGGSLASILSEHQAGFHYACSRMELARQSPKTALWFVFFSDLFETNKELSCMKRNSAGTFLDPKQPTALCYKVLERDELDKYLGDLGLRHQTKYVSDAMVDALYKRLGESTSWEIA